jgi:hypothetical protein
VRDRESERERGKSTILVEGVRLEHKQQTPRKTKIYGSYLSESARDGNQ